MSRRELNELLMTQDQTILTSVLSGQLFPGNQTLSSPTSHSDQGQIKYYINWSSQAECLINITLS